MNSTCNLPDVLAIVGMKSTPKNKGDYTGQFVYYESIKRDLKRRLIYEYRCDERLKTKNEESTRLTDKEEFVYYESIKRGIKRRLIYEYR